MRPLLIAFCSLVVGFSADAATCTNPVTVTGGATATGIVELYTSEGCDSCPPTDKWFSTLPANDANVIPLAFHVDYWDYIGWKDRFGKPSFAQRQREEVVRQGSRTVYTPQILLNGKNWRGWQSGGLGSDLTARPARATLTLNLLPGDNQRAQRAGPGANQQIAVHLTAKIDDAVERKESGVFIAVTENNLLSRVNAGENRGVTLKHDHVVRELIGPLPIHLDGVLDIVRQISLPSDWKNADLQVVTFVQNRRNGEILQAISAPVCRQ